MFTVFCMYSFISLYCPYPSPPHSKSKQKYRARAMSDNQRSIRTNDPRNFNVHAFTTSDMSHMSSPTSTTSSRLPNPSLLACHTIKENTAASPADELTQVAQPSAIRTVLNHHPASMPNGLMSPEKVSPTNKYTAFSMGSPTHLSKSGPLFHSNSANSSVHFPTQHTTIPTNSSVASSISVISDQSFVNEFHSITAELENIDAIVRNQVRSSSMTSLLSDLGFDPKSSVSPVMPSQTMEEHIKNNTTSYSQTSHESNAKQQHLALS